MLQASPRSLLRAEEDDLKAFLSAVAAFDDLDLTAVIEALKKAKPKTKATKGATRNSAKKPANVDESAVTKYVHALRSAHTPEAVANILQRMKSVKAPETKAIANGFRGFEASFGSKNEALAAIEARALSDIRAKNRTDKISEIF